MKPLGNRFRLFRAQGLLAGSALLFACRPAPPPPPPPPPAAATVDGVAVTVAQVQRELDRLRRGEIRQPGEARESDEAEPLPLPADPKELPRLARVLLEPLIDRQILVARAKAAKLTVSEAEVQRATDALAEDARAAGQSFSERLTQDGLSREQLADETRERLLARRLVAEQLKGEAPSAQEVKAFLDGHRAELDTPEQVHALQIVVSSPEQAKSLLDQLRKGAAFEELARLHGQSPDARRGGDLGFFARGTMPKEFDDACFSLKQGQVSGVVRSRYGFHLFKVIGRKAARRRPAEDLKAEAERRLTVEKRALAERTLLAQLREKANVQVDEAALGLVK